MNLTSRLIFKRPLLLLIIWSSPFLGSSQEPNDCINAITVCGNSNFSLDVSGIGTQELAGSNTCSSQENNSLWLRVSITSSGTLAFTLTPESTSINEDYDFFVFGPNASCGNIGQAIRCSTTNPAAANQGNNLTGMNATATDTSEGPGADGDSFVSDIDVLAGETYFIVIDRPIGNSPFSLEWTGTASFPDNPSNPLLPNQNTTTLPSLDVCDSLFPLNDAITEIDLSTLTQDILNGANDITISYHSSESDANINTNALGTIFNTQGANQTIFIRIENSITGCFIINEFAINVTPFTNFNTPTDYEVCDDDSDGNDQNGLSTFDFNIKNQEITNGISGINLNISYHLSQTDAENNASPLPLIYTNTTATPIEIFVRIEDLAEGCVGFSTFNLIVNDIPEANTVSLIQCDEDGIPEGFTIFNLNEASNAITNNNTNASVNYYLSQSDAQNDTNPINSEAFENFFNPQIIYTRVTNANTSCVNFSQVSLEVSTTNTNNANLFACDDDGNEDGFYSFNLDEANGIILAGAPSGLDLTYYETYQDALLEINAIGPIFTNTIPHNQFIYVRAENNNDCFGISDIELTVSELPNIQTETETVYCLNFFPDTITLDAGIINDAPSNYFFDWSTGENTAAIQINAPGTYSVRVTNTNGCFKDRTIIVQPSNIASITDIQIADASQDNSITVFVNGEGSYEYALDDRNGPYQDSSVFENVQPGLHTVYVRDKNNCGIIDELVSVIGFPLFFTPNGDDKNEHWQVIGITNEFQTNSLIYIFDRHGKLLTQLDPLSIGWDGTYNGHKMPTSDYWFKVKLQDGRTFTSHFTLKR